MVPCQSVSIGQLERLCKDVERLPSWGTTNSPLEIANATRAQSGPLGKLFLRETSCSAGMTKEISEGGAAVVCRQHMNSPAFFRYSASIACISTIIAAECVAECVGCSWPFFGCGP